ncbi:hypothetical protein [Variovorax sp. dw_954]|uniref:hypothetical protein n=1 Tax=Variovorax sp. dw_954 TaxID=2720078 RepID=UPI001BD5D42F|nr:hypothetical protein [Variovorax sp. dw_954]
MKRSLLVALCAAVVSASAFAAGDHGHAPRHGGVVAETRQLDQELTAKPDVIRLYLRDHGKPVDITKASARLTLLSGSEKQEVELRPAGDRLEATGAFKVGPGTKAVTVVTGASASPSTARFTLK